MQLNKWVSVSEDFVWQNTNVPKLRITMYTGPILSAIYMPASATVYNPLDGSYGGVTTKILPILKNMVRISLISTGML